MRIIMNVKFGLSVVTAVLVLSSCANNDQKRPKVEEIFATKIEQDGTKKFSYSLLMSGGGSEKGQGRGKGKGMGGGKGGGMGGGKHGGQGKGGKGKGDKDSSSMEERLSERLFRKLERKLAETAYCRDGYIELDSSVERSHSQVRGECKDGATDSDFETFPNS